MRLVRETGKPIAQVARDLGINEGTLGNWVDAHRRRRDGGNGVLSEDERAELARLRRENAELAMSVAAGVHGFRVPGERRKAQQSGLTPIQNPTVVAGAAGWCRWTGALVWDLGTRMGRGACPIVALRVACWHLPADSDTPASSRSPAQRLVPATKVVRPQRGSTQTITSTTCGFPDRSAGHRR